MELVRELKPRFRLVSFVRVDMREGIEPIIRLELKSRVFRPVKELIDEDIVPCRLFDDKESPVITPLALQVTPVQVDVAPEHGNVIASASLLQSQPVMPLLGQLVKPCLNLHRPFASGFNI